MMQENKNIFIIFTTLSILLFILAGAFGRIANFILQQNISRCEAFFRSVALEIVPNQWSVLLLITGIFLCIIVVSRAIYLYYHIRKLRENLMSQRTTSSRIRSICRKHNLEQRYVVVENQKPFAFCFGVRNANIFLSTGMALLVSDRELEAILLHEKYHLDKRDSLFMTVASLFQILFPFFPLFSDMVSRYRVEREIQADQAAITTLGNDIPLVSVLRKLLMMPNYSYLGAASIADETLESRIHLLVYGKKQKMSFQKSHIVTSFLSFAFLLAIICMPVSIVHMPSRTNHTFVITVSGTNLNAVCTTQTDVKHLGNINPGQHSPHVSLPASLPLDK